MYGIRIIKIRPSNDRLIFIMWISILPRRCLYFETDPRPAGFLRNVYKGIKKLNTCSPSGLYVIPILRANAEGFWAMADGTVDVAPLGLLRIIGPVAHALATQRWHCRRLLCRWGIGVLWGIRLDGYIGACVELLLGSIAETSLQGDGVHTPFVAWKKKR